MCVCASAVVLVSVIVYVCFKNISIYIYETSAVHIRPTTCAEVVSAGLTVADALTHPVNPCQAAGELRREVCGRLALVLRRRQQQQRRGGR